MCGKSALCLEFLEKKVSIKNIPYEKTSLSLPDSSRFDENLHRHHLKTEIDGSSSNNKVSISTTHIARTFFLCTFSALANYRVCHRFRLAERVAYFGVYFENF